MPERTEYAHGTPSWVDLATTDVAGAETFYAGMFGWESEHMPAGDGIYSMQKIGGKYVAALYEQQEGMKIEGAPPAWVTYISVDDLDATTAKVVPAGGAVLMAPFDVMDSGRMSVIADPAGAVVSLWQAKSHIGSQLTGEHGTISWNELISTDAAASRKFLEEVLGVGTAPMPDAPNDYTLMTVDGAPVAGVMQRPEEMGDVPSHWMVYFAVTDCDLAVAGAVATGGSVVVPPTDIPPGRFASLQDPQGVMFSVITLNPEFSPNG